MSDKVRGAGKKSGESSVYKSSEEYDDYCCDPCKTVGDYASAAGYCSNCEEYLCNNCLRSHSRSKLSKTHVILEKDAMPRKAEHACEPCKFAGDKIEAVGFCKDCQEFLCRGCYKYHSRNKLSRHHVLLENANISKDILTSSVAKMNINQGTSNHQNDVTFKVRDFNVKADSDKRNCYIVEMVMVSDNDLLLFDKNNSCLKHYGVDNSLKDTLIYQDEICGMTAISNDLVAAVIYNKYQIHIINVRGKLSKVQTIKTNWNCLDVKMVNGKLYVSFNNPVKFQVLKLTGAIIKTIQPEDEVLKHCKHPRHIAVSPDENVIYASDFTTNKVIAFNMNGQMTALYSHNLDKPYGVFLSPTGSVYICNRGNDVVYRMTSALSEVTVVIGPGDNLRLPQAIAFDRKTQHIYISRGCNDDKDANRIGLYQLK